jgi:hypothetical protein
MEDRVKGVPSSPLQFCGVGDSDEFFDLVVLIGDGRQIEREVLRDSVPS